MPNWCDTSYRCTGNKKGLKKLFKALSELEQDVTPRVNNGFGNLWLGCVVDKLGGDWEKVRCRGEVLDFYWNDAKDVLTIDQSTAWCEQREFREFLELMLPGTKIYYLEEEPGCGVFYTNDLSGKYFPDRFILDYSGTDGTMGYTYYSDLDNVISSIESLTNGTYTGEKTTSSIEKYLQEWNTMHKDDEDVFCYLYAFEYSE